MKADMHHWRVSMQIPQVGARRRRPTAALFPRTPGTTRKWKTYRRASCHISLCGTAPSD